MVLWGEELFTASREGLSLINLRRPWEPRLISRNDSLAPSIDLAMTEDFLFLAQFPSRIVALNRADLRIVGSRDLEGVIRGIDWSQDLLAVAAGQAGVYILDASDPENLPVLSHLQIAPANDVCLNWTSQLLVASDSLVVWNAENPSNPDYVGSVITPYSPLNSLRKGDVYLYSSARRGVTAFELSHPDSLPNMLASYQFDDLGVRWQISAIQDYVFTCGSNDRLEIISFSNPDLPRAAVSFPEGGLLSRVFADPGFAYVTDEPYPIDAAPKSPGRLHVIDVSDPDEPAEAAITEPVGRLLEKSGHYLYFARGDSGVDCWNIADPVNPSRTGRTHGNYRAIAMKIAGDLAFIATGEVNQERYHRPSGLTIMNVAQPNHRSDLSFLPIRVPTPDYVEIETNGDYLYLLGFGNSVRIIDVTDPERPRAAGQFHRSLTAQSSMTQIDSFLYVAQDGQPRSILSLYSLNFPATPFFEGEVEIVLPPHVNRLETLGGRLLVNTDTGISLYDIEDRLFPRLIETRVTSGRAYGVAKAGELLLVAEESHLGIYDASDYLQVDDRAGVFLPGRVSAPFPNPFNGLLTIPLPASLSPTSVDVRDLTGRRINRWISQPGGRATLWNASGVASGTYLINISQVGAGYSVQRVELVR
jgi:hypothetical protein